jgi:hypothetical protein
MQFARVRYQELYPGVDLVFYGKEEQLEYDIIVAPGANAGKIRLAFDGQSGLTLAADGDLVIGAGSAEMRLHRPVVYQLDADRHIPVAGRFVLHGSEARFELGRYDARKPVVIDPALTYSTYLAGNYFDYPAAIAVTTGGSLVGAAIIAGETYSSTFPVTTGTYQQSCTISSVTGLCSGDAFVAELNLDGTQLVYSTFLGGSDSDGATGVAVDSGGNAYIVGTTYSPDFPTTSGAYQTSCTACAAGGSNIFAAKISPSGASLLYSTYLGGNTQDAASGIAIDSTGDIYLTGYSESPNYPTTPSGVLTTCPLSSGTCDPEAVFTKLNPALSGAAGLVYSTFIPGVSYGAAVATDSTGIAYIGATQDTILPMGGVVAKIDSTKQGSASLLYSTSLAGVSISGIGVNSSEVAYITGITSGFGFKAPKGGYQTATKGTTDAYVASLSSAGVLTNATYLGGTDTSGSQTGIGIAVATSGNVYVLGQTQAPDFPVLDPVENELNFTGTATFDAFVAELNPALSKLTYSTYLGTGGLLGGVVPQGIAVGASGSAFVTGYAQGLSPNYPVSSAQAGVVAYEPVPPAGSQYAGFVSKIATATPTGGSVAFAPGGVSFGPQAVNQASLPVSVTLMAAANAPLTGLTVTANSPSGDSGTFTQTNNCPATLAAGSSCVINVTVTPPTTGALSGSLSVTDSATGSPQIAPLTATGALPVPVLVTNPVQVNFPPTKLNTPANIIPVTLTNEGAATLTFTSISAGSGDFTSVNGCSSTLAPNTNCIVNMTYTPTVIGPETGTLVITDNASNSPQSIPLTGSGPNFVVTTASAGQTITAGQAASTQVQITPEAGYNYAVGLNSAMVGTPPTGLTCSVSPKSVTLDGVHTGTSTLTVQTTTSTPAGTYKIRVNGLYKSTQFSHTFFTVTVQ